MNITFLTNYDRTPIEGDRLLDLEVDAIRSGGDRIARAMSRGAYSRAHYRGLVALNPGTLWERLAEAGERLER